MRLLRRFLRRFLRSSLEGNMYHLCKSVPHLIASELMHFSSGIWGVVGHARALGHFSDVPLSPSDSSRPAIQVRPTLRSGHQS